LDIKKILVLDVEDEEEKRGSLSRDFNAKISAQYVFVITSTAVSPKTA
jgi:hypothetical protein